MWRVSTPSTALLREPPDPVEQHAMQTGASSAARPIDSAGSGGGGVALDESYRSIDAGSGITYEVCRMRLLKHHFRLGNNVPTAAGVHISVRSFGRLLQRRRFSALQNAWFPWLRKPQVLRSQKQRCWGLIRLAAKLAAHILIKRLFFLWRKITEVTSRSRMDLLLHKEVLASSGSSFCQWIEESTWLRRLQTKDALHRLLAKRLEHETEREHKP